MTKRLSTDPVALTYAQLQRDLTILLSITVNFVSDNIAMLGQVALVISLIIALFELSQAP